MSGAKRVIKIVRTDIEWRALAAQASRLRRMCQEIERGFPYEIEGASHNRQAAMSAEIEAIRKLQKHFSPGRLDNGPDALSSITANLGAELIRLRLHLEIPQKLLAQRMGVTPARICVWERQTYSKISLEKAARLVRIMQEICAEAAEQAVIFDRDPQPAESVNAPAAHED